MSRTVTVITLQNVRNYGYALQAIATQEVFRRLGCDIDFINYIKPDISTIWKRLRNWGGEQNIAKRVVQGILLYPTFVRQEKIFKSFISNYLNQQEREYTCEAEFKDFPITSDIY